MRTIKFRGKSVENLQNINDEFPFVKSGDFVYGSLLQQCSFPAIGKPSKFVDSFCINTETIRGVNPVKVDTETIGQFTGLYDRNGNEIYEGDIVKFDGYNWNYTVIFDYGAFKFRRDDGCIFSIDRDDIIDRVLGNIHDLEMMNNGKNIMEE